MKALRAVGSAASEQGTKAHARAKGFPARHAHALALALTALLASCSPGGLSSVPSGSTASNGIASQTRAPLFSRALPGGCPASTTATACSSQSVGTLTASYVSGFTPADIQAKYGLPSATSVAAGAPLLVVVSAYDTPNAENDLNVYRKQFGLPPCTSATGCFKRVNSSGTTSIWPSQNSAWNAETMLDLEMASAACAGCRLMLVEASSSGLGAIGNATQTAATFKPVAISESLGVPESVYPSTQTVDLEYKWNIPGIAIVAATGDNGAPQFPAVSRYVIAAGGTQWDPVSHAETAWNNAGGGCSINVPRPSWQTNSYGCSTRGAGDVVAFASATDGSGVAVYNSSVGGWFQMIGTSVAAPIIAGAFAAANDYPKSGVGAAPLYAKASALGPLPPGCQGKPCGTYGLGVPSGLAAF